ncbi:glycine hydroxymethyltransferase [Pseudomonas sp. NPDC090592]|uniref:glycine hydroxymethyltransferase n=1 Tax=Pseudomonas sp. NPDC090592 TaxID=3364480 RepID=UPI00383B8A00
MTPDSHDLLNACAGRLPELQSRRLMLYAGANLPSSAAVNAYSPALSAYPAMGPPFFKEQPETDLVSELEMRASHTAMRLFNAAWAEVRLPSCTLANLAIYHAFCRPGDRILAPAAEHGGHLSQRRAGTPQLAGLQVEDLPFDTADCQLDTTRTVELIESTKPKLVVLGRSVMLKADDIAPVVRAAKAAGAKTLFDASHVLGLIAGGVYPNPFDTGVDLISSSTYKTLPGRPQGLVLGRSAQDGQTLRGMLDARMLANYDAGRLPSLLLTLEEALADGGVYASAIVSNSAALHGALKAAGLPVIGAEAGETHTHQLLLPLAADVDPRDTMLALQTHGILIGTCVDPSRPGHSALRLGTQFITRQGMGTGKMQEVAQLLAQVLRRAPCGRLCVDPGVKPARMRESVERLVQQVKNGY